MEYKILATFGWRQGNCVHPEVVRICYHLPYITSRILPAIRHLARGDGAAQPVDFPAFLEKIVENRGEAVAMGEVLVLFWGRNFINGK